MMHSGGSGDAQTAVQMFSKCEGHQGDVQGGRAPPDLAAKNPAPSLTALLLPSSGVGEELIHHGSQNRPVTQGPGQGSVTGRQLIGAPQQWAIAGAAKDTSIAVL
jgi:hypothetical protein